MCQTKATMHHVFGCHIRVNVLFTRTQLSIVSLFSLKETGAREMARQIFPSFFFFYQNDWVKVSNLERGDKAHYCY